MDLPRPRAFASSTTRTSPSTISAAWISRNDDLHDYRAIQHRTLRSLSMPTIYENVIAALRDGDSINQIAHLSLSGRSGDYGACLTGRQAYCTYTADPRARDVQRICHIIGTCSHLAHLEVRSFHMADLSQILGSVCGELRSFATSHLHSCVEPNAAATSESAVIGAILKELRPTLSRLRILATGSHSPALKNICMRRRVTLCGNGRNLLQLLNRHGGFQSVLGNRRLWQT
ncbi:hypothetical protein BKA62DRAFT_805822 [Auriculariales sp. MPI-PUGE-AT-0066]|nr:hypothetical protein BKA62DRAFT_805822 [Auriculariales sp. MPI-PUGE-AT-0066]